MATIEPRLIHLLNETTTPQLPHADLPSIHALHLPTSLDRSGRHADAESTQPPDVALDGSSVAGKDTSGPGLDEACSTQRRGERYREFPTSVHPLQLLLRGSSSPDPLQPAKGAEEPHDGMHDMSLKKRSHALAAKDDFLQLPQPFKKQKASGQTPQVPPIIKPLLEPPPHAARFPPISSTAFAERNNAKAARVHHGSAKALSGGRFEPYSAHGTAESSAIKCRKRATKPRRKWTEDETKHLLLGVHKHGVGKWTSILEDSDFKFNDRTAGDLKDRFRTCCPDELRRSATKPHAVPSTSLSHEYGASFDKKQDLAIMVGQIGGSTEHEKLPPAAQSDFLRKAKKSRAHRKNMDDLAEMGIHGPFKKSHRRERRPFTDQDDREILEGLDQYGPAWTKIQRDPRFSLASRQPTDLRDRVRNKYPEIYQRIEKGTFQPRDGHRSNDILEPSVHMMIDHSLQRTKTGSGETQQMRSASNQDLARVATSPLEASDANQSYQDPELGETILPPFISGEMDISRLLLDDSRLGP